jgi:PAS domain S-box-containing protein
MALARRKATEALRTSESQYRGLATRLKALLETTSRLIETLETRELLSSLLDLSHEIVAADALGVWRMNDEGDWSIIASSGLSDEFIQEFLSRTLNIDPPEEAVVVQPSELADRSTPLLRYRWERYDREGIRSLMIMPLLLHGNVSGTLVFYCRSPHVFTEIEIESAQALANIAAAAITTAELYENQSRLRYVAEEAAIRESFLASAGAILSESLDYEQTLANVARAAVPEFADWCAVDLLDDEGGLQRLAVAHIDPQKVALAQELLERYPPDPEAERGISYVVRTGKPELMRHIPDDLIVQAARDDHHLRLIRELQLTSYICVPLQAGGTVYGTITFVSAESKQPFEDQDLNTAQEIARHAAQAIDNARLYGNLREGEQRLRLALTAARAGVWELDVAAGSYHWSHEFLPLYGYDAATPRTYEQWISSVHPDDRERVEADFGRRLDSDEIDFQQEFRIIHPKLGLRWILDVGHIERDENGRALRCIGINMDITERKQAEEALQRYAEESQILLDTLPIGVFFAHDPQARHITGNRAAYELLRLPVDANLSKSAPIEERPTHFRVYQNGEELPPEQLPTQRAARGEQIRNEEVMHVFEDGTALNILVSAAPLFDSEGHPRGAITSLQDITERTQTEAALKAKEAELALVTKIIPLALTRCSRDLRYLFANRAAAAFLGLTPDQLIGKPIVDIMGEKAFAIIKPYIEQVLRGEPVEFEANIPYSTGGSRWVRVNYMPDYDEQGNVVGWVASIVDITSRKQAEEALRQLNETLEERVQERTQQVRGLVAQLTMAEQEERRRISQILHDDLQQLLSAIKMKLSMLHQDLQKIEQAELATALEEDIAWVEEATTATRLLTVDLSPPILQNQALLHAIEWLQNQMKELHGLEVAIEAEHDWYIQDEDLRVLLFQIIRELLFNVKKHAGVDQAVLQLKEETGCLVIHVIDEGQGFDVEEATAQNEYATGFGLFSVRGRLHPLGGRLEILSQPGAGTHIAVYTPVQAKALNISRLPSGIVKKPRGRT